MFLKSYLSAAVIGATVLLSACGNSIDESNTVRVIVNNADGGTVTVDHLSYCVPEFDCPTIGHKPASADCEFDESCEVRYVLRNSTAQLSATPWPGYEFVGWSEACTGTDANCSLNVGEENPQVTAVFNYIGGDHPFDSQISIIDDTLRGCVLYPAHKEDLSSVAEITSLTCREGMAKIQTLAGLAGLTALEELVLHGTLGIGVTNLNELAGMTQLQVLKLDRNNVVDASALANLDQLTLLSMTDNALATVNGLDDFPVLEVLHLRGNPVASFTPLFNGDFPALEQLYVGDQTQDVQLDNFDGMSRTNFPALDTLFIQQHPENITDIAALLDMVTGPDANILKIGASNLVLSNQIFSRAPCAQVNAFKASNFGAYLGALNSNTACQL